MRGGGDWELLRRRLQQPRNKKECLLRHYLNLVEEHFRNPVTIREFAQQLHCTPKHLRRTCREILGCTPKECLLARRLAEAQSLLSNPELHIKSIAYRCGFSSPTHFSARFKAHFTISPSRWRIIRNEQQ